MRQKENSNISYKFLVENIDKEELKKKYVAKLLNDFFNNNSTGKSQSHYYGNLLEYADETKDFSLFDFYQDLYYYIDNWEATNKEEFCKEVILKIYNTIFFGRVSLLDSFVFLHFMLHFRKYMNFTITYNDLEKLIVRIASLSPSFSAYRGFVEANVLYLNFINVLINLRNNYDIDQKTIPIQFLRILQDDMKKTMSYINLIKEATQFCTEEIEKILLNNFQVCTAFLTIVGKESLALEKKILDKAKEPDPIGKFVYMYVQNCKNGRFRELEEIIANKPSELKLYIEFGLRQRAPELEPYIATDSRMSLNYALLSLKEKRFPAGEKAIAKDPWNSYLYAKNVIQGRFPEGEETIARGAGPSFCYATGVLYDRFPKGEPAIFRDESLKEQYKVFLRTLKKNKDST